MLCDLVQPVLENTEFVPDLTQPAPKITEEFMFGLVQPALEVMDL